MHQIVVTIAVVNAVVTIAVVGAVHLCLPFSFELCLLLGPPDSLELLPPLSLAVLLIAPLLTLLCAALVLLCCRARLLGTRLVSARLVVATSINASLLSFFAAPVAALSLLFLRLRVLILSAASIVPAALRLCHRRDEQQRCGC